MRTLSYAGRTKKSWWEKGTKKLLRDAVPVWDPWDLDPGLQLHTAEHHARDEELGFWRNQAALAHGECREKEWVWSEEVLIASAQTAARAQSAWRTFDLEYGGIRENISRPVVRHTGERGAAWAPVGGERKKGLLRPRTANPAGRVHWDAEAPMKPRPKSASAAHKLDEAAARRPNSGFGRPPLSRVAEGSFEGKSVFGGASGGGRGGYSGDDNDTESAASFIKEDASEADLSSAGCSPQQARRMGGDTNVGAESQVNLRKMQVSSEPILRWERCRQIQLRLDDESHPRRRRRARGAPFLCVLSAWLAPLLKVRNLLSFFCLCLDARNVGAMSYLTHAVCSHARRRLCGYNACALRKVGRVNVTLGIARVMQVRAHAQWHLAVHCLTCESPHACT